MSRESISTNSISAFLVYHKTMSNDNRCLLSSPVGSGGTSAPNVGQKAQVPQMLARGHRSPKCWPGPQSFWIDL